VAFSGTLQLPNIGENRPFPAYFRVNETDFLCSCDYVAEDAVRCEPFSGGNSLLTGKKTGNFVEFGRPERATGGPKLAALCEFRSEQSVQAFD
jgi:hypothetical protein